MDTSILEATGSSWPDQQTSSILALALTTLLLLTYFYYDFQDYLALGPGGTPSTVFGYTKVKALGLFALQNPYACAADDDDQSGYLSSLPYRGPRPMTKGIAPHRQIDQRVDDVLYQTLLEALQSLGSDTIKVGRSHFEKYSEALFATGPNRITQHGEICHSHPIDGSMHLTLHPSDVKVVLDAKWGERHPLARGGRFERFVPETFVMVYAPRNQRDIETVVEIVKASAWYVGGGQ